MEMMGGMGLVALFFFLPEGLYLLRPSAGG